MNAEDIHNFVLSLGEVSEGFPFGEELLVMKTNDKMFLILPLQAYPLQFNAKCDPEKAIQWREEYPDSVLPGYHMSKKHWNTVIIDGKLSARQLKEMIKDSYDLVKRKVKKG
jgi:predicted DNA-binding protein (MmcQ/YjbR family)